MNAQYLDEKLRPRVDVVNLPPIEDQNIDFGNVRISTYGGDALVPSATEVLVDMVTAIQ